MATSDQYAGSSIPQLDNTINSLQKQADQYQSQLQSSPGGIGSNTAPGYSDISNQQTLQRLQTQIQAATDAKLKQQWYTKSAQSAAAPDQGGGGTVDPGLMGTITDYLSRPLYGIEGAVKSAIGQGTGNMYNDAAQNMVTGKQTFSDLLKNNNVPWYAAAPLGFALNVAADPVNWATMGSATMVPRVALGMWKGAADEGITGALRGAGLAVKSQMLDHSMSAARLLPQGVKDTEGFQNIARSALDSSAAYEKLTNSTVDDLVQQRGFGAGPYRVGLGDFIQGAAKMVPGGEQFYDKFLKYDPISWVRDAKIKDALQRALGMNLDPSAIKGAVNAYANKEDMTPFLGAQGPAKSVEDLTSGAQGSITAEGAQKIMGTQPSASDTRINFGQATPTIPPEQVDAGMSRLEASGMLDKINQIAPSMVQGVDDASSVMKNPSLGLTTDLLENVNRIAGEAKDGTAITLDDLKRVVNSGALGTTGWKWFDDMGRDVTKFKNSVTANSSAIKKATKATLDAYDTAMSIFSHSKVGASLTSWTNAVIGNMAMSHMAGINIADPQFARTLGKVQALYRGKSGSTAFLEDLLRNADGSLTETGNFMKDNPTATGRTLGLTPQMLGSKFIAEAALRKAMDVPGMIPAGFDRAGYEADMENAMKDLRMVAASVPEEVKQDLPAADPLKGIRSMVKTGKEIPANEVGSGMQENEMYNSPVANRVFEHIAQKAKENPLNPAYKLLDFTFNKMPNGYETIDQVFKMTNFVHAVQNGFTRNEIMQIRHYLPLDGGDLKAVSENGITRYRMSPAKALEMANTTYLNYNAMPGAVKILKNIPLVGMPFTSFLYGMLAKTGQALAYNPSTFNKVNFALNSFGGQKTPLEKQALTSPYYSYLNQPGMFRVPFTDANPVYANMANMIPYYSFNMFNPSQRSYQGAGLPGDVVSMIDASPFFKNPFGSAMFDYMIQPMILQSAGVQLQNSQGSALYPSDADGLTKAGYGARSLAESFTPNLWGLGGLSGITGSAIPSYRWRQLAEAEQGKDQYGMSGKEPAISRTLRTLASTLGVPLQAPVNLTVKPGTGPQAQ